MDKDPLDVGEGWYEKHHIPTEAEIRAGNHLHNHIGELTSLNYDKYQALNNKNNKNGSRNSTPNRSKNKEGKENTNTRQSPENVQELNADDDDGEQSSASTTVSSGMVVKNSRSSVADEAYGSAPFSTSDMQAPTAATDDDDVDIDNNHNSDNRSRRSSGEYSENSIAIA